MLEKDKQQLIERTVMVAADRVDSLVSRPNFHELSNRKAMTCLTRCLEAVMAEMDNYGYTIKTKNDKNKVYVNIKLFDDSDEDFDVQLRYSITGETT
jgi:hypothetical protein